MNQEKTQEKDLAAVVVESQESESQEKARAGCLIDSESPESIKDLVERGAGALGVDLDSCNKLNLKKLDYGYRVRTIKDESGAVESKIMDRGFIGLTKNKVLGLDSVDIINCFIYGKKTVGFYIDGDSVYANHNLKKSTDFIALLYNVIESQKITFGGWVDNLPTGVIQSSAGDLAACIKTARTIDDLDSVDLF